MLAVIAAAQPSQRPLPIRATRHAFRHSPVVAAARPRSAGGAAMVEQQAGEVQLEASNIVAADLSLTEGQKRKLEYAQQAAALLEQENSWWLDDNAAPSNLHTADTPAAFKRLIVEAPANQLVVVDYLKPGCAGCRRLFPKLKQIAAQNPDALFLKVNVESATMRELAQGMQVTHLPWFHLFRGGQQVASFSANVTTVSTLRAEVAAHKACEDPSCQVF